MCKSVICLAGKDRAQKMDMTHAFWDETTIHQRVKYEGCTNSNDELNQKNERPVFQYCDTNLNFSTATCSEDDSEYSSFKKNKVTRQDPMSHRIIEKRRRDRMNNCLADLSRLIPTEYLKKGRGRIEKTEIIEMAIKYMKCLQHEHNTPSENYRLGYQECMSEAMRFMVEVEGHFPREGICLRFLDHLQKHCETLTRIAQHPSSTTSPINTQSEATPSTPDVRTSNLANNYQQTPTITTTKPEPNNNNNNNNNNIIDTNEFVISQLMKDDEMHGYDKHQPECHSNGFSYKYKTNIKMRFSQDLNEGIKRQKLDNGARRMSIVSIDNHSSSHSSPPSSDLIRISDPTHHDNCRISPSQESTASLKIDRPHRPISYSPPPSVPIHHKAHHIHAPKTNFNVPIFVLHAKGAFYIPLTIEYKALLPYLRNVDLIDTQVMAHNFVVHPVTINVNYNSSTTCGARYKNEFGTNWN